MVFKKKHKISLLIIAIVVCLGVNIYQYDKKAYEEINELSLYRAPLVGEILYLEMHYPDNDARNIDYVVGEQAQAFFDRWEALSKIYAGVQFPYEAIKQGDWEIVEDAQSDTRYAIKEIDEEFDNNFVPEDEDNQIYSPVHSFWTVGRMNEEYQEAIGLRDEDVK
ncbi:hypothetical protein HXZ66_19640 [Bacillus sp. A116_S68]|nr:hypothetical protein HXZ66_19640 [Bacillus sp. A116_S68]